MSSIDCIVIGHNDVNFTDFAQQQRTFADRSAGFSEVETNSIRDGSMRLTYMDLFNKVMAIRTGQSWQLNAFEFSLAVACLVNRLIGQGIRAEGIHLFNSGQDRLVDLLQQRPTAVAITTTYYVDDEPIKEVVRFVRQHHPEVSVIIGGPRIFSLANSLPRRMQDLTFKVIGGDIYVVSSEGEATLGELMLALRGGAANLSKIPNLIYLGDDGSYQRTELKPERNDLNENAIDWQRFDASTYTPTTYMRTARSCPFKCAFCNYPALSGKHTLATLETIEKEMKFLADQGLRYLIIVDDTFNVPLPRFKEICRMMIRNGFEFQWVSFFRCSNADDEAFDLMKQSGCLGVYLGIESGDQQILENMNKFADVAKYSEGFRKLNERGILTLASIIVGFPGETEESVSNTIDFLNAHQPTFYNVQVYYHDTLAPIEQRREEFGIEGSALSWKHATMDWQEAVAWKEHMLRRVEGPIQLPLYGFSIWTIPYLLEQGLSLEQVLSFGRFANRLGHAELNGESIGIDAAISEFCKVGFESTLMVPPSEDSYPQRYTDSL